MGLESYGEKPAQKEQWRYRLKPLYRGFNLKHLRRIPEAKVDLMRKCKLVNSYRLAVISPHNFLSLPRINGKHMIDTVIFDMDGLLIDSEPLWGIAMREVFATVGVNLSPELTHLTTGLRTKEVVSYWHSYYKWEGKSAEQVVNEIIDSVIHKIIAEGHPMEGLQYILQYFREKGFKMGLASSSPLRLINAALEHLQIKDAFQAVYSAEFEDYGKPHPAVYLACAKALGSDPLDCIAFEDSVTGMTAAKAARMTTVVVPEAHNRHDPRYALANMKLDSLLEFNDAKLSLLMK